MSSSSDDNSTPVEVAPVVRQKRRSRRRCHPAKDGEPGRCYTEEEEEAADQADLKARKERVRQREAENVVKVEQENAEIKRWRENGVPKNTVFVLSEYIQYEGSWHRGVFSSFEKATEFLCQRNFIKGESKERVAGFGYASYGRKFYIKPELIDEPIAFT